MTPAVFRRLALALEGASEGAHGGHADFRAAGRVFATVGYPDQDWAMVKLTPDQQRMLCAAEPAIFRPVKGGWGAKGATNLRLAAADDRTARSALAMALRNVKAAKPKGSKPPAA
jgi:YjbR